MDQQIDPIDMIDRKVTCSEPNALSGFVDMAANLGAIHHQADFAQMVKLGCQTHPGNRFVPVSHPDSGITQKSSQATDTAQQFGCTRNFPGYLPQRHRPAVVDSHQQPGEVAHLGNPLSRAQFPNSANLCMILAVDRHHSPPDKVLSRNTTLNRSVIAENAVASEYPMKIWNLPTFEFIPFDELEETRPVIAVTNAGAWEAVPADLQHLNLANRVTVTEATMQYLEARPPDRLIIDMDVLATALAHLHAVGFCDPLSIATGLWGWEFAAEADQNPEGMELVPWAADAGDDEGLKQLLDCLTLEVQFCNQLVNSRPEEGSEHYFAYASESFLGNSCSHAELVGPSILLMAEFQDQDTDDLEAALKACHISLENIPEDAVGVTLKDLPVYFRKHDLPYGIAHELKTKQ
jgi:hypothetical protein